MIKVLNCLSLVGLFILIGLMGLFVKVRLVGLVRYSIRFYKAFMWSYFIEMLRWGNTIMGISVIGVYFS